MINIGDKIRIGLEAILVVATIIMMLRADKMMDRANELSDRANVLLVQENNIALRQEEISVKANDLIDTSNEIQNRAIKVQKELVQATIDAEDERLILQDKKAACTTLESQLLGVHNIRLTDNSLVLEYFRKQKDDPYILFNEDGEFHFKISDKPKEIYLTANKRLYNEKRYLQFKRGVDNGIIDLLAFSDAESIERKRLRKENKGLSVNLSDTDRTHIELWRKKRCYDF